MKTVLNTSISFHKKNWLSQNKYMYRFKIAGMDQVSFGPVPVLMVVKIIWSTAQIFLPFNPTHRLRVCVRREYVLAWFSMLHYLKFVRQHDHVLKNLNLTF